METISVTINDSSYVLCSDLYLINKFRKSTKKAMVRAWKIAYMLVSVYVSCMQKFFDVHEKTCTQIISQLKLFPC